MYRLIFTGIKRSFNDCEIAYFGVYKRLANK
jgi:hypothetical protein